MNSKDKNPQLIGLINNLHQTLDELEQTEEVREYFALQAYTPQILQELKDSWNEYYQQAKTGTDYRNFAFVAKEFKTRMTNGVAKHEPYSYEYQQALAGARERLANATYHHEIPTPSKFDPAWMANCWHVTRYWAIRKLLDKLDPSDAYFNAQNVFSPHGN